MKSLAIPTIFTALDRFTAPVTKMGNAMQKMQGKVESAGKVARKVAVTSFAVGAAITAPLALFAKSAIDFEDRQADVAKTTGLSGAALDKFGSQLLTLSAKTRTPIEDLQKIAEIGGQLGIDPKQLVPFTDAVNKFNVALGADFAGGVEEATAQVGKIRTLFKDTGALTAADAIIKTGSAINELGAVGAGTSANITEFTLRLGGLPAALKPSATSALALGTYLEEVGINAEIGAGGLTKFLLDAGNKLPAFAKQMGISAVAAKQLLAQSPDQFALKFAQSLQGMAPDKLAKQLTKLGIGSQESIKVLGALSTGTARLTELQNIANKSFIEGTSLQNEYNKKNETTAAKLAQAKNNLEAFSITAGTQLLPVLTDVLNALLPVIQKTVTWMKENPGLTKTILAVAGAIAVLSFVIGGIASVVAGISSLVTFFGVMAPILANYVIPALQVIWVLFGAIVEIIAGALGVTVGVLVGGIALLVSIAYSFYRNWQMITAAFKNGGIIAGLKAIGATILDAILWPLQKVLEIVAKLPVIGGLAAQGAAGIQGLRADMGIVDAVNPKAAEQDGMAERNAETTNNAKVDINVNDPKGRTTTKASPGVNVNTSSTMNFGGA